MQLVKYEQAKTALAEAHRVDEVKDIRDKAQALAAYARQAKDRDMIQWATEIKVRAERRAGDMLAQGQENGELAPPGGDGRNQHGGPSNPATTLADIGISRDQSSRWKKLAAMPEEHFEAAIETAKSIAGEVTTAFMLRQAKPAIDRCADESVPVVYQPSRDRSAREWAESLYVHIEDLARIEASAEEMRAALPEFQHYRVLDNIDGALRLLNEVKRIWTAS